MGGLRHLLLSRFFTNKNMVHQDLGSGKCCAKLLQFLLPSLSVIKTTVHKCSTSITVLPSNRFPVSSTLHVFAFTYLKQEVKKKVHV